MPVTQVDEFGLSPAGAWESIRDAWRWAGGNLNSPTYGPNSPISQDLQRTPAWRQIWEKYKASGCRDDMYCGDYQYQQFFTTFNVAGQAVGGFCAKLTRTGNTVTVNAFNDWGLESGTRWAAFPGLGSNRRNSSVEQMFRNGFKFQYPKSWLENRSSGPGRTVRTTYTWTEANPCCGP